MDELTRNKQDLALQRECLMNHEVSVSRLTQEANDEKARRDVLARRVGERRDAEKQYKQELVRTSAEAEALRAEILKSDADDQAQRRELSALETRASILKSDVSEAIKHEEELQGMVKRAVRDGERMSELHAAKSVQWERSIAQFQQRAKELEDVVGRLDNEVANEEATLKSRTLENENMRLLEFQTTEDREAELGELKEMIDESTGATGSLHKRMTTNYECIREHRRHIEDLAPETQNLEARLSEKKRLREGLVRTYSAQVAELRSKVEAQVERIEHAIDSEREAEAEVRALEQKIPPLEQDNSELKRKLAARHLETADADSRLKELHLLVEDAEVRLKRLEEQSAKAETELGVASRDATVMLEDILVAENDLEIADAKLSDCLAGTQTNKNNLSRMKEKLQEMQRTLALKESGFKIDSIHVAAKIRALQSSLIEKVEVAERATSRLVALEATNSAMQKQLALLHDETEATKVNGVERLTHKRDEVQRWFSDLGARKVAEVTLQNIVQRKEEEKMALEMTLKRETSESVVLKNQIDMNAEKVVFLQNKIDRHHARVADLSSTVDSRGLIVSLLQRQLDEKDHVARSLKKQLTYSQHEMMVTKDQQADVLAKQKAAVQRIEDVKIHLGERLQSQTKQNLAYLSQRLKGREATVNVDGE
jgi:chromosome segregation ATPase